MPRFYKATSSELAQVNNEFFTARAALPIPQLDFTKEAQEWYDKLKDADELPEGMTRAEAIKEINNRMQVASRAADVADNLTWEFENVRPLAKSIFIRFKYDVLQDTPDSRIYSRWVVGDPHSVKTGEPGKTPVFVQDFRHSVETFHEIEISSEVIPESGKLAVVFYNYPSNDTVSYIPEGRPGSFIQGRQFHNEFHKVCYYNFFAP